MGIFSRWRSKGEPVEAVADEPRPAPEVTASPGWEMPPPEQEPELPPASEIDTSALTAPVAPASSQPAVGPPDPAITAEMQGKIVEVLKTVYDPEIPVDIYELGLIYDIGVDAERRAHVKMTLTSPACPSAQQIPSEVRYKVKSVPGISDAAVEIVWEPPWDKDRMSEAAKLQLGFY
jgi:FeS assembly SUF system protein